MKKFALSMIVAGCTALSTTGSEAASGSICDKAKPANACSSVSWSETVGCYTVYGTLWMLCKGTIGHVTMSEEENSKIMALCKAGSSECKETLKRKVQAVYSQIEAWEGSNEEDVVAEIVKDIKAKPEPIIIK